MRYFFPILCLLFAACSQSPRSTAPTMDAPADSKLYSMDGREFKVSFEALFASSASNVSELPDANFLRFQIKGTTQFLFGPLIYRDLGGVQKGEKITPHVEKAVVQNGRVMVPYTYEGVWLVHKQYVNASSEIKMPLPYTSQGMGTEGWKNCTDPYPEHQILEDLWYYWDPSRQGCPHKLGVQYQEIVVRLGDQTVQTTESYPEYRRMIRKENGKPVLAMTFAFGYVHDSINPSPLTEAEEGMYEFQKFHSYVESTLVPKGFTKTPITQSDFGGTGSTVIGSRFTGLQDGVEIRVSIVSAAGIDQMDLFAHSYAHEHEGFFGWFGHSRVGSGFDAQRFQDMVMTSPQKFSLSPEYQLVYWNGCNSYSYYTTPFFEQKAKLNPTTDPKGTKNLDLLANGLPTFFRFNYYNATVVFNAIMNWKTPTSYQKIVNDIEGKADQNRIQVLVNVLGDEDNGAPETRL